MAEELSFQEAADRPEFSRASWLAAVLRERVITGRYPRGQRLREADLQREFAFSNGPVREALQLLVADGLLEREAWRGVRVVSLTHEQIVELFQLRLGLFAFAAELAAKRAGTIDRATVEQLHREMDEGFDGGREGEGGAFTGSLTQWVLGVAGNARLKSVWDRSMLPSLIFVNAAARRSSPSGMRLLIHQMIDAIAAGDAARATEAARALTRQTLRDLGIEADL